ncbi:MAG: hypothetical protein ACXWX7_20845, partial [Candidatus Binatia bacterium]
KGGKSSSLPTIKRVFGAESAANAKETADRQSAKTDDPMRRRSDLGTPAREAITDPWQCMTDLIVENIRRSREFTVESITESTGACPGAQENFWYFLNFGWLFS